MDLKFTEKKEKLKKWKDFYGGDLINSDEIDKAKTEKELSIILNKHEDFLDSMHCDAMSNISQFRNKLKL